MKPMILITVALSCGLVAAIGVYQQMNSAGSTREENVKVVVASKEISINEAFNEENVEIVEWSRSQVPPGAISSLEELVGMYAKSRFYPGIAVVQDMIMDGTEASRSVLVPNEYRVVSVKVSLDSSVSNLIEPGDRVDVIVVLRDWGDSGLALAKTILMGVRVFAVNSEIAPSLNTEEAPEEARAVSLILKPDQVEKLMMATEMGTIKLSLRSPDDSNVEDPPGCTPDTLLGRADVADEVSGGELDLNRGTSDETLEKQNPSQPYFSMLVLSPGTGLQYNWAAEGAVPQMEVLYSSDNGPADDSSEPADEKDEEDGDFAELDDDIEVTDYSDAKE